MKRRLFRILINGLTVLSLLLCGATCVLWVRSYFVAEHCGWATSHTDGRDRVLRDWNVWSASGGVGIFQERYRNLVSDSGSGTPFFHSTDAMMIYPYVSQTSANIPERRWEGGGITVARSSRGKADLWMEADGSRSFIADAQLSTSVVIPWWLLTVISAVLPLFTAPRSFIDRRQRRRVAKGTCFRCGYDLRATPGRCPECGTEIPTKAMA